MTADLESAFLALTQQDARYMSKILEHAESNLTIIAGEPRPVEGMINFISQANQTGLVVVIVVAAGALAFAARRGVSTFLRTRTRRMSTLVAPRFTSSSEPLVLPPELCWYCPLPGTFPAVRRWLPSSLATAPVDLLGTAELLDYLPALSVAVVATGALVAFALRRLQGREV